MARHYSPPGTFEVIRKEILEDPSLTNAEFRLALYLVTKPDGWVIRTGHLATSLGRSEKEIKTALRGLRHRGWVVTEMVRSEDGSRIIRRDSRFCRDLVTAKPQVSPSIPESGTEENGVKPQVSPSIPESGTEDPTSQNGVKPQVSPSIPDSFSEENGPIREDGVFSEDGSKPVAKTPPGRASATRGITDEDPKSSSTGQPQTPPPVDACPDPTEGAHEQMTFDGAPATARRGKTKQQRTEEELAVQRRAGAITNAWTATQVEGLFNRAAVMKLVTGVLLAGQFDDEAVKAALLRLAARGITPSGSSLGRELTHPSGSGQARNGQHRNYQEPDRSVYKKGFRDAYHQ